MYIDGQIRIWEQMIKDIENQSVDKESEYEHLKTLLKQMNHNHDEISKFRRTLANRLEKTANEIFNVNQTKMDI